MPLAQNPDEEWAKDIIDLRRLVSDYPKHKNASEYKLNFSFIQNPALKAVIKRYFRARLGFWTPVTQTHNLHLMKPFLIEVGRVYPDLCSFAALSRPMIEPLLLAPAWTDERGARHPLSRGMKSRMCTALNVLFHYMMVHEWDEAPQRPLIHDEDKAAWPTRKPRPIPPSVMEQLAAHLDALPPDTHNLVEIIAQVGLRAEDALHLTEECLDRDAANDPILRWFNHKMNREGPPLPIDETVVAAIERQRALVTDVPDHFGRRYLFRTTHGLYRFRRLCDHLNKLAETVPIRGPDGQVYHFRPHAFRHTVGTQLLRDGMGIVGVKTYLDHASLDMTMQYVEITTDDLKAQLKHDLLVKPVAGGASLAALVAKVRAGDERDLDWLASRLHKLIHPNGYCLHHPKSPLCPYGQNVCFHTPQGGPCEKLVITEASAPRIITTLEDLRTGYRHAKESGTYDGSTYLQNLENEMRGMEMKLAQFDEMLGEAEARGSGTLAGGLRGDIAKVLHHREHGQEVAAVRTRDEATS